MYTIIKFLYLTLIDILEIGINFKKSNYELLA